MVLQPGTLVYNRYRIIRQIGQGGMGAVYEAVDERLARTVALKQKLLSGTELDKAFEREAKILAGLRHPALTNVIDHFDDTQGQFLVMDFIPGKDLAVLLEQRDSPFSVDTVLDWADQILQALDYLHNQQPPVIHRDIKPQNLKLTEQGHIVLLDFGLAKGAAALQTHVTGTGSIFGFTPQYAPLEQIEGTGTGPVSDLYALSATLYHLLTGAPPENALKRTRAVLNEQPDPLRPAHELNPQVPVALSIIIQQALSLQQHKRPASAAEMRDKILEARRSLETLPQSAVVPVPMSDGTGTTTRNRTTPFARSPLSQTRYQPDKSRPGAYVAVAADITSASASRSEIKRHPTRHVRLIIGVLLLALLCAGWLASRFVPLQSFQHADDEPSPIAAPASVAPVVQPAQPPQQIGGEPSGGGGNVAATSVVHVPYASLPLSDTLDVNVSVAPSDTSETQTGATYPVVESVPIQDTTATSLADVTIVQTQIALAVQQEESAVAATQTSAGELSAMPTDTLAVVATDMPIPTATSSPLPTPTAVPEPTLTPTAIPIADTPTHTPTPTSMPMATPTHTLSPTSMPTATPTPSIAPTATPTAMPTNTPTDTPTNTPTDTHVPTDTPTNTPTDTPTNTPTDTPTNTPTDTPTNTPTDTPTNTPTHTHVPTDTPLPPRPTDTQVPASGEPTDIPSPPPTPSIQSIEPTKGQSTEETLATITGTNFDKFAKVELSSSRNKDEKVSLQVRFLSDTQLEVTVPKGTDSDMYDVVVANPDGGRAVLKNAFRVLRSTIIVPIDEE